MKVTGKLVFCSCLLLSMAIAATGCSRRENLIKCQSADPDTRIAGCTALIQTGQDTPRNLSVIYNNRGSAYNTKRDYDRAIQDFNEAIRLNPNDSDNYRELGIACYGKGDYDRAIQDYNLAIHLNSNDASAFYRRGDAFSGRGLDYDHQYNHRQAIQNYTEAIQDYDEAIFLNPANASAEFGRGLAYDRRGLENDNRDDYNRAIQDLGEAIRLKPKDAGAYTYRGMAFNQKGDYDQAIQDLNEATRLNPKDTLAYIGRGASYLRKGDFDRAMQDFEEVVRLNPKDTFAYEGRGEVHFFQSNLAAAMSDFETAISDAPSSRMAVFPAAMLHVAMKRQGRDDSRQLAQVAAAADLSKWPGPVLQLDMGKMTAGDVMAAAAKPGDDNQKWHVCQANYFIGEDALLKNQRTTALTRLKAARDTCPKWDLDYLAALVELKRLGASAASPQ